MSPSRQGRGWSRYRCLCGAADKRGCMCGDVSRDSRRVFFKDLEHRNLNRLFSPGSADRIHIPIAADWRSRGLFK